MTTPQDGEGRAGHEALPLPRITISLVVFDGAPWLPGCLASLTEQETSDFELLIHDNASRDDSLTTLRAWASTEPRARVVASEQNLGYAAAHNRAIQDARGDVVLLLNQDVELDRGFLAAVLETFGRYPDVGAVQARLRQLGGPGQRLDRLDSTGLSMGRDRRAVSRAQGQADGPRHQQPGPVWGVDGPAPAYRRRALLDARLPRGDGSWEVLDEDFFLYKEDVDLAWRLRLLGWRSWYAPAALAWHARGTGTSGATKLLDIARANRSVGYEVRELSWRNQRLMQIKNESLGSYLRDLPWIVRRELLSLGYIVLFDRARLRAVVRLISAMPAALRKRRYLRARIQRSPRPPESRWGP